MKKILSLVVIVVLALAGVWMLNSKPEEVVDDSWKTFTTSQGVIFRYPEKLDTTYISTADWPPQVSVIGGSLNCTEAGSETERSGKTEKKGIDGRTYCVTKVTEGAAGSVYTQYAYLTETGDDKLISLTFSLRFVQCGNYEEPDKSQCETERTTFNMDSIVDSIVSTI